MEKEFQQFLENYLARVKPLAKELFLIQWQYDTTGDESLAEKKKKLEAEYVKIFADPEKFAQLKTFARSKKIVSPMLKRQLKILLNVFRFHQGDRDYLEQIVKVESEINSIYNHFRGQVEGKSLNNNEIKHILQHETDSARRRKAWEASKQVGAQTVDKILEVVSLRNQSAHKAGYADYYALSLACKEMDEQELFDVLDYLREISDEPFREAKNKLDADLAKKFRITPAEMRPWHYGDPFFQELPPYGQIDTEKYYTKTDIQGLIKKTYQSIGMDIDDLLQRSDLYPKEGKCQHAYCSMIDRENKDIRVLANIDQTEYWTSTMLHEFGHAVYDKYIGGTLPHILKTPAHTLSTEAIAMMMEALIKDPGWMTEMVGAPVSEIESISKELHEQDYVGQMVFLRWALVMIHFERDLYRNPGQDLNKLWWDYVEKFQYVTRPEGRNAPDWAAKIHLALVPVYYQNYLYGQMVASQLLTFIQRFVGNGQLYNNPILGPYLTERYFRLGSQLDWNSTLARATGEPLNPHYYIIESLGIPVDF